MTAPQEPTAPPRACAYGLGLGALFFLSGALGLLYEIVWFRRLHLALGVSLFAVGAVVSAYMLGLAVGSRWAARSAWLRRAPLTAYAGLELGIALYALAFPLLVGALEALYPALFRLLEGQPLALSAARFVLAFVLLLPPTFLMGASLPAMAEAVVAPPGQLARRVAWLYALNTVGGVAGTLVAGFLLIEHLGITRSLYIGAAGSALVAAAAFALARVTPRAPWPGEGRPSSRGTPIGTGPEESAGPADPSHAGSSERARGDIRLATSAALVAGAVSLASEIVWTRALVFFVHNSTYAFSAIVAVYLLGIAAGALVAARFARTRTSAAPIARRDARRELRRPPGGDRRLPAPSRAGGSPGLRAASGSRRARRVSPAPRCRCGAGDERSPSSSGRWRPCSSCRRSSWAPSSRSRSSSPRRATGRRGSWAASTPSTRSAASPARSWARSCSWPSSAHEGRCCCWPGSRCRSPSGPCARRSRPAQARTAIAGLFVAALAGGSLLAAPRGFYQDLFEKRFGRVVWFAEGVTETVAVCEHKDAQPVDPVLGRAGRLGHVVLPGRLALRAPAAPAAPPSPVGGRHLLRHRQHARGRERAPPRGTRRDRALGRGRQGGSSLRGDEPRRGHERPGPDRDRGRAQLHAGDRPALRRHHRGAAARPHRGRRQPLLARLLRAVLPPPHRRRHHGGLARHLGAGDARDADARPRVRGRLPPRVALGLHPPRRVAPHRLEEAAADRPRRARGAHGQPRDRPRPRADRRRHGRDPLAGRPPLPPPDGARRARRLRRRRAAGHRRPERRRLHDAAARPRQLRPGGVGHRRALGLRGGGARPAERAPPARVRPGLHVPRAGRAADRELRRP